MAAQKLSTHASSAIKLLKAVLLTVGWIGPLHIAVVVDEVRDEERIVTMYEPDPNRWSADYLGRR